MCGISWQRAETATYERLYIGTVTAFLCDEEREGQEMEGFGEEHPARCKWSYGNEVRMNEMQMAVM